MSIDNIPRHNVFVSYQHADQIYKDKFVEIMGKHIIDKSVGNGEIDSGQNLDRTRMEIREKHIRRASVTVVLIGRCTWQRKHVDWEINYSLSTSDIKPFRNGLLGILLPNHLDFQTPSYTTRLMPPRLADNCDGDSPFAYIYDWSKDVQELKRAIHDAFVRRRTIQPNNGRREFAHNWHGVCENGW